MIDDYEISIKGLKKLVSNKKNREKLAMLGYKNFDVCIECGSTSAFIKVDNGAVCPEHYGFVNDSTIRVA